MFNLASDRASKTAHANVFICIVCKRTVPDHELILERMILPGKCRRPLMRFHAVRHRGAVHQPYDRCPSQGFKAPASTWSQD